VTALIHGREAADRARAGARASFGGAGGDKSAMPTVTVDRARFEAGYPAVDLFVDAGLGVSKSEIRRLVEQGGAFILSSHGEFEAISDVQTLVFLNRFLDNEIILRAGKKRYCRILISSIQ
jgi:tyrosyl-tRNA synthetase